MLGIGKRVLVVPPHKANSFLKKREVRLALLESFPREVLGKGRA